MCLNCMPTRELFLLFSLCSEKGRALLEDAYLSVWELTSSCSSRRRRICNHFDSRYTCTISDEEKSLVALHDKPQSASSSPTQSPKTPRPSKIVAPTPIQSGPQPTELGQQAISPESLLCLQHLPFRAHVIEWTC